MPFFVSIYIDTFILDIDFTHTFINLTYKLPDELNQEDSRR